MSDMQRKKLLPRLRLTVTESMYTLLPSKIGENLSKTVRDQNANEITKSDCDIQYVQITTLCNCSCCVHSSNFTSSRTLAYPSNVWIFLCSYLLFLLNQGSQILLQPLFLLTFDISPSKFPLSFVYPPVSPFSKVSVHAPNLSDLATKPLHPYPRRPRHVSSSATNHFLRSWLHVSFHESRIASNLSRSRSGKAWTSSVHGQYS